MKDTISLMKLAVYIVGTLFTLSAMSQDLNEGLVGYWPLNGDAQDMSGNGNDGEVYGAVNAEGVYGDANGAFYFDGQDDYIKVLGGFDYDFENLGSIFLWVKFEGEVEENVHVVNFDQYQPGRALVYIQEGKGAIGSGFRTDEQSNAYILKGNKSIVNDHNWHAVCYTYDGQKSRLYIDGELDKEMLVSFSITSFSTPGYFGCYPSLSYFFKGALDEIRLYNRALSVEEIQELYGQDQNTAPYLCGTIYCDGENIGIGVDETYGHKLAVGGTVLSEDITIKKVKNWPDYVFEKEYDLMALEELEAYITAFHHLPEVPQATHVASKGISVLEMNKLLLKKVEELTLYLITENQLNTTLREEVSMQKQKLELLESELKDLKQLLEQEK